MRFLLSCPLLSCRLLSCTILSYPVLSYPLLFYPVLSCPLLSCPLPLSPPLSARFLLHQTLQSQFLARTPVASVSRVILTGHQSGHLSSLAVWEPKCDLELVYMQMNEQVTKTPETAIEQINRFPPPIRSNLLVEEGIINNNHWEGALNDFSVNSRNINRTRRCGTALMLQPKTRSRSPPDHYTLVWSHCRCFFLSHCRSLPLSISFSQTPSLSFSPAFSPANLSVCLSLTHTHAHTHTHIQVMDTDCR